MRMPISFLPWKVSCVFVSLVLIGLSPAYGSDCNGNDVVDVDDIAAGLSDDCNSNDVPDACEGAPLPLGSLSSVFVEGFVRNTLLGDFDADGLRDWALGFSGGLVLYLNDGGGDVETYEMRVSVVEGRSIVWGAGDLDVDGDLDFVGLYKTGLTLLTNRGDGILEGPLTIPVSEDLTTLGVGDVSGDGVPDIVVTDRARLAVLVLGNRGDGTFEEPVEYSVGQVPRLQLGDLNGDGVLDVVTANQFTDDVSLLVGRGDGTLSAAVTLSSGGDSPLRLAVDDLDDDGRNDIILANGSSLAVLRNETTGVGVDPSFAQPALFFPEAGGPSAMTTGDLDGDGHLDVLCAFTRPIGVLAFLGDGAGFFTSGVTVQGEIKTGFLRVADLDGDEAPDLIISPTTRNNISIRWNAPFSGSSPVVFRDAVTVTIPGDPHTAALADVEGDGDLDLVAGNNNEGISVYRNDGTGVFAPPENYPSFGAFGLGFSFSIALTDLDSDGDPDIASADIAASRVQVLTNDGQGVFNPPMSYASGANPFHVTTGDFDGDGHVDVASANESHNNITVLYNDGAAGFGVSQNITAGVRPVSVAAGDLDGDGDLDFGVSNTRSSDLSIIENEGARTYSPAVRKSLFARPNFLRMDDLDGDGQVDLSTSQLGRSVSVFFGTNSLALTEPRIFTVHTPPYTFVTQDLDVDGDLEIVTISELGDGVSVLVNGGDRTFALSDPLRVGDGPRYVVAGDIDADGDGDVIGANRLARTFSILFNDTLSRARTPFFETLCTAADFYAISVPAGRSVLSGRVAKYIVPARDDPSLLPALFQNANLFVLHEDFLRDQFPDEFARLSGSEYDQLVGRRATRDYYAGFLRERRTPGGVFYTFSVVADTGFDAQEVLSLEEVRAVYDRVAASFQLRPLAYEPLTELDREQAAGWGKLPFDVFVDDVVADFFYEPYTLATGFGRVRLLTLGEFEEANQSGLFTFQDVLVIDQAPRDIEGVVGGVITGAPQGALSHVAIRTARRGTPNAFVEGAHDSFRAYDGKLIRLQVFDTEYFVDEATTEEAEAFWASNRPRLAETPAIDAEYGGLDALIEVDLDGKITDPVARHGGKATNFSRLQVLLNGEYAIYQERGFSIPMKYYLEFLDSNTVVVDDRTLSYGEYLAELLTASEFQTDSRHRFETLERLRDLMRSDGVVDPALVTRLAVRIEEVFGRTTTMVRFRSSSNVEDVLVFNGAGLYESTSVCAADTLDAASPDASHCDASRQNERTIERALKKVWASLWTFRAHEERTFFQIPPESATMGILVSRAFLDEIVNGVAFTGNPRDANDKRYVITAQVGETSVVSPPPGTIAERNLLEVVDGQVVEIIRSRASSLVPSGTVILDDLQLRELGALMAHVEESFPLDLEGHDPQEVVLDFEFKIEPGGLLAVKQVRPFLIPTTSVPKPTFELEIPSGTTVCAVFSEERVGRPPLTEYETKSQVRLRAGRHPLTTGSDSLTADLIDEVLLGPAMVRLQKDGPGEFRLQRVAGGGNEIIYRFGYEQRFMLPTGERFEITISALEFRARGATPLVESLLLDDEFITFLLTMQGSLEGQPVNSYSSCTYDELPLWGVEAAVEGELALELTERFLPSPRQISTGRASVVRVQVVLGETRQTITDYWRLVYAARRHNQDVRYWVVLEPSVELAGLPAPVHVIELAAPELPTKPEATITYLDAEFQPLGPERTAGFVKDFIDSQTKGNFVRGDVDGGGTINITDALSLLNFLFRNGTRPLCAKAADADDSGRLDILDAIRIIGAIVGRGTLPAPTACGVDPSEDALECAVSSTCG
jgi:hypothetical protein